MPAYKSYCWSLGTTSFRMVEFNRKIEEQLKLLNEFWQLPANRNAIWNSNSALQTQYYNFIKERGFIEDKDAPRKDKDAREKTSGLVDIGLITDERRLTPAGQALLVVAENATFDRNNILQIPSDSFIYLKQLLKTSISFEGSVIRPYIVLAYLLAEFGELSKEEFTYLMPLAINQEKVNQVVENIRQIRAGAETVDDAIVAVLENMPNYIEAKSMFLSARSISESLIMEVGMNRKSRKYDKPYFQLYNLLGSFRSSQNDDVARRLFHLINSLSGRSRTYWKQYLFTTSLTSVVERDGASTVKAVSLFRMPTEQAFRNEFFRLLHLFKAKSLLDDYFDLNKRYFKTTDTILFQDNKVKFDIIPNCYFSIAKDRLTEIAFESFRGLGEDCSLAEISEIFNVSQVQIFSKVEELYGVQVRNLYDIQNYVEQERYDRFNAMIDERFSDNVLIDLMTMFERRDDGEIHSIVTNNADIPTIFEYILAITWYKVSGRQGKVLEYMNLSLDADLLPITHAAGGHEDITYHYDATESYPAHTLLIEATLANNTNQRRMEMEPVSRHLGTYLLTTDTNAYCLFVSTFLDPNVISDFRGRKLIPFRMGDNVVHSMKILSCATAELKRIIANQLKYSDLYPIFENAYQSDTIEGELWYEQNIKNQL